VSIILAKQALSRMQENRYKWTLWTWLRDVINVQWLCH